MVFIIVRVISRSCHSICLMQLCIHITRIADRNIEVFGSPGLFSCCTVRHDPSQQVALLRALERHCSLPTHSTSVCSCARWVESSDSRPQIALSCCHTQLMFLDYHTQLGCLDYHTRLGCLDCRIHIEPFSSQILLLVCVAYFFATPFHFVFPQHRNAVPDISPVPLQVTTALMEESVFGRSVLETVVTTHERADHGSSIEPLVVVAVSRRFLLCFQVCFSFAQEGCLVLSLCTAFLPGLATRCLPVLFECTTKRDMDRVWKI